jgi:hypothetical protein
VLQLVLFRLRGSDDHLEFLDLPVPGYLSDHLLLSCLELYRVRLRHVFLLGESVFLRANEPTGKIRTNFILDRKKEQNPMDHQSQHFETKHLHLKRTRRVLPEYAQTQV